MRRSALLLLAVCAASLSLAGCKKQEPAAPRALSPLPPVTLPSGLKYQVLAQGEGQLAKGGDKVEVHYVGKLADGTVFDSSRTRNQPFAFRLGAGQVISGWDEGVAGMKEGELRKLEIPPDLGYGSSGTGPIPPNATLHFEVELVDVK